MANPGTVNVDLQMTGSGVRLRALELAIGTLNHDFTQGAVASKEEILKRAEAFEQYIERGKPEEAAVVSDEQPVGSGWARSIEQRWLNSTITGAEAEYLINSIRHRTRD